MLSFKGDLALSSTPVQPGMGWYRDFMTNSMGGTIYPHLPLSVHIKVCVDFAWSWLLVYSLWYWYLPAPFKHFLHCTPSIILSNVYSSALTLASINKYALITHHAVCHPAADWFFSWTRHLSPDVASSTFTSSVCTERHNTPILTPSAEICSNSSLCSFQNFISLVWHYFRILMSRIDSKC